MDLAEHRMLRDIKIKSGEQKMGHVQKLAINRKSTFPYSAINKQMVQKKLVTSWFGGTEMVFGGTEMVWGYGNGF